MYVCGVQKKNATEYFCWYSGTNDRFIAVVEITHFIRIKFDRWCSKINWKLIHKTKHLQSPKVEFNCGLKTWWYQRTRLKIFIFETVMLGIEHKHTTAVVTMAHGYVVSGTRDNPPPAPEATLSSVYMWKRTHCWSCLVDFQFFDLNFC